MKIDRLAEAARANAPRWDEERADRVLASTLVHGERRVARARFARRSLGVASAMTVVVFVLLRGAPSSADASGAAERAQAQRDEGSLLASHGDPLALTGDGGYGRD